MSKGSSSQSDLIRDLEQIRSLAQSCIERLGHTPAPTLPRSRRDTQAVAARSHAPALDFDSHERAFVKKYAHGLSGPKKFVLLLAYLAKGQVGKEIQLKEIEQHWNRMTSPSLLDGKFNRFYTNTVKEQGWVNTKKQGLYVLRPSWQDIFTQK